MANILDTTFASNAAKGRLRRTERLGTRAFTNGREIKERRRSAGLAWALAAFGSAIVALASPALPISDLDHLSLHVSDVRRSAEFYIRLFGTDVSRDPNRQANPGSVAGELWFVRLGDSHLSLSPVSPGERPGFDHFCFAVTGFDGAAMKASLVGFEQPWPDWPSGLWIRDPDHYIIQFAASTSAPSLPTIVRNAVPLPAPNGRARQPMFRPLRLTQLTLRTRDAAATHNYYRKLLGDEAHNGADGVRIGRAVLTFENPSVEESFQVGIAEFNPEVVMGKLIALGIAPQMLADRSGVWFRDPDGIRVQIGGMEPR